MKGKESLPFVPRSRDLERIREIRRQRPAAFSANDSLSPAEELAIEVAVRQAAKSGFRGEIRTLRPRFRRDLLGRPNRPNLNINFDPHLLQTALVAETIPTPTEKTEAWLKTLRGRRQPLTGRQKQALTLRHGLSGEPKATHQKTASRLEISTTQARVLTSSGHKNLATAYRPLIKRVFGV